MRKKKDDFEKQSIENKTNLRSSRRGDTLFTLFNVDTIWNPIIISINRFDIV